MWTFEPQDRRMHLIAAIVAMSLTAALSIYLLQPLQELCNDPETKDEDSDGFANCADSDCADHCACLGTCPVALPDMKETLVEASLAFKAETPVEKQKQPQKEFQEKEQQIDPDAVARDDKNIDKQKSCTRDADCDPKDECIKKVCVRRKNTTADTDPLGKVPDRTNVDDLPTNNTPTPQVGAFDGSKHGRGPVNKGDPYFVGLKRDLLDEFKVNNLTEGAPAEGCIHMTADGKITETKLRVRNNDTVTSLAEDALKALQRRRNEKPEPVPTHLLEALTTQWICFKFTATDAE